MVFEVVHNTQVNRVQAIMVWLFLIRSKPSRYFYSFVGLRWWCHSCKKQFSRYHRNKTFPFEPLQAKGYGAITILYGNRSCKVQTGNCPMSKEVRIGNPWGYRIPESKTITVSSWVECNAYTRKWRFIGRCITISKAGWASHLTNHHKIGPCVCSSHTQLIRGQTKTTPLGCNAQSIEIHQTDTWSRNFIALHRVIRAKSILWRKLGSLQGRSKINNWLLYLSRTCSYLMENRV